MTDSANGDGLMDVRAGFFVIVPRWVGALGPHPLLTYYALAVYANNDSRAAWPSQRMIANAAGISERAVRRALATLVEAGAVTVEQRFKPNGAQTSSIYRLAADPPRPDRPPPPACVADELDEGELDLLPVANATDGSSSSTLLFDEREPSVARTHTRAHEAREAAPDVTAICAAMARHVELVTGRPATITAEWRRHARLMLDRDGVTVEIAVRACEWLSSPGKNAVFWSANVLSVPTLRAKLTRLHVAAQQDRQAARAATQTFSEARDAARDAIERLRAGGE